MRLNEHEIGALERITRLNIVNSITGIKPANLIGSRSGSGRPNLAIFSSVIHIGSDPALVGFVVRPSGSVRRDTLSNILETGQYTINHVGREFVARAHSTSAKFDEDISEFKECGLSEELVSGFDAPFVKESAVKLGLQFEEQIPIESNGTSLVIGKVKMIIVPDAIVDDHGHFDLEIAGSIGISGLNTYYALSKISRFPYARTEGVADIISSGRK